jgi:hypothetical protein
MEYNMLCPKHKAFRMLFIDPLDDVCYQGDGCIIRQEVASAIEDLYGD